MPTVPISPVSVEDDGIMDDDDQRQQQQHQQQQQQQQHEQQQTRQDGAQVDEHECAEELRESDESRDAMPRFKTKSCPTSREIQEHNRTHVPFRSWCPHCIAGRGADLPHMRKPLDDAVRNEISIDYCFLRDAPGGPSQAVLAGRDRRSGIFIGHAVPFKGSGVDWIAQQLARDIMKCGYHGRVTIRGDQEPALQDLLGEVARLRGDLPTVIEGSPVGDSKANGYAERAVKSIEEMVRTHKLALEKRVGEPIPITHKVMPWLIEHCADILNKFQVGKDGRTPYERLKGKQFHGTVLEFGAQVMIKVTGKLQGGLMQERWIEGTWLGMRFHTQEHIAARAGDGVVVRTRAVRELPRRTTLTVLDQIVGDPHAPAGTASYEKDVERARMDKTPESVLQPGAGDEPKPVPRGVRITKEMLEKFGYSSRCPKCRAMERNAPHPTAGHSKECRQRVEKLLKADPEYQTKFEAAEARKAQFLAEEVERADSGNRAADETSPTTKEKCSQHDGPQMSYEDHPSTESFGSPTGTTSTGTGGETSTNSSGGTGEDPTSTGTGGDTSTSSSGRTRKEPQAMGPDVSSEIPLPEASIEEPAPSAPPSTTAPKPLKRPIEEDDGGREARRARTSTGGIPSSTLKRGSHGDEDEDERPPQRTRLEALCAVVHGPGCDREEEEIKQLCKIAGNQFEGDLIGKDIGNPIGHEQRWEDYWTPWWEHSG